MYFIPSINTDKIRGVNQELADTNLSPLLLKVLTTVKSSIQAIQSLAFWQKGDLPSSNVTVLNWDTTAKVLAHISLINSFSTQLAESCELLKSVLKYK